MEKKQDEISINNTRGESLDKIWSKLWETENLKSQISSLKKNEGLRWKLKFAPCHGKFLEAGCGTGQYVYYFSSLGFDIDGLDISKSTIENCINFKNKHTSYKDLEFNAGDVRKLSYDDNSISYYLSFGVIEHFKEGPKKALDEAYRVLKPGGIAYFGTPTKHSLSNNKEFIGWIFLIHKMPRRVISFILRKIGFLKTRNSDWIEYKWDLKELKSYVKNSGFLVVDCANIGLKATFDINWRPSRKNSNIFLSKIKRFFYPILDKLEDSYFGKFGINNLVIGIKPGKRMHCFFCGTSHNFNDLNLGAYSVCTCNICLSELPKSIIYNYKLGKKPRFNSRIYVDTLVSPVYVECDFCSEKYERNSLFGDMSFDKNCCDNCLIDKNIGLVLRNNNLKYTNI